MKTRPLHTDVVLSSGRVVTHSREPNGSQLALVDGGGFTTSEYREYTDLMRAECERSGATFVEGRTS